MNVQSRLSIPAVDTPAMAGGSPVRVPHRFMRFVDPAFADAEVEGVVETLRRRWTGAGSTVAAFEARVARHAECLHAVAVNSSSSALHLALLALGVGPGDEVITTALAFCSTVNVIIHAGAEPVLADCEHDSLNISPDHVEALITPRTKAVVVVHFAGRPCDMDAMSAICRTNGLLLIEDCTHALEALWRGRPVGTIGQAGCFGFPGTRTLTTGESGAVVTADARIADRVRTLALHGLSRDNDELRSSAGRFRHPAVIEPGFACDMTDLQAAAGLAQFDQIQASWERRQIIWRRYDEAFAGLPLILPQLPDPWTRHAYHLYTPRLDLARLSCTRDDILHGMTMEGIGVAVHYLPIHTHPFYRRYFVSPKSFVEAEFIGARTLSLPLAGDMDDAAVDDVITAFRRLLRHYAEPGPPDISVRQA